LFSLLALLVAGLVIIWLDPYGVFGVPGCP
jgi:hypothetical protein